MCYVDVCNSVERAFLLCSGFLSEVPFEVVSQSIVRREDAEQYANFTPISDLVMDGLVSHLLKDESIESELFSIQNCLLFRVLS